MCVTWILKVDTKVIIVSRYGFIDLVGAVPGVRRCCPGIKWDNSNIHRS